MTNLTREEQQEARERRMAEVEVIESAYSPHEVWTKNNLSCYSKGDVDFEDSPQLCQIIRSLDLPLSPDICDETSSVKLELTLTMPSDYPVSESDDAALSAEVSLVSAPSNPQFVRKAALNAIPNLKKYCQKEAMSTVGSESVMSVLNCAENWIHSEWGKLLQKLSAVTGTRQPSLGDITETKQELNAKSIIGRRIIYSHHIIANSKRKALSELASQYKLGGYAKIGWPGVIVIEGDEFGCQQFVNEIKSMRWKHLSVRAEEQSEISRGETDIDPYRKLPKRFEELGEDDMSILACRCRDAGLEHLFLLCMKINDDRSSIDKKKDQPANKLNVGIETKIIYTYGALIHVDHMNDGKGYRRWLRQTCQTAGCSLLIKNCRMNSSEKSLDPKNASSKTSRLVTCRPDIFVGIFGHECSVRQVLKRWRTSRVDVDSKNKPCLERMMNVIHECELNRRLSNDALHERDALISGQLYDENNLESSFEDFIILVKGIDENLAASLRNCNRCANRELQKIDKLR